MCFMIVNVVVRHQFESMSLVVDVDVDVVVLGHLEFISLIAGVNVVVFGGN